jgi:hypothetical protein
LSCANGLVENLKCGQYFLEQVFKDVGDGQLGGPEQQMTREIKGHVQKNADCQQTSNS